MGHSESRGEFFRRAGPFWETDDNEGVGGKLNGIKVGRYSVSSKRLDWWTMGLMGQTGKDTRLEMRVKEHVLPLHDCGGSGFSIFGAIE